MFPNVNVDDNKPWSDNVAFSSFNNLHFSVKPFTRTHKAEMTNTNSVRLKQLILLPYFINQS